MLHEEGWTGGPRARLTVKNVLNPNANHKLDRTATRVIAVDNTTPRLTYFLHEPLGVVGDGRWRTPKAPNGLYLVVDSKDSLEVDRFHQLLQ
jgi:hypothetical protein